MGQCVQSNPGGHLERAGKAVPAVSLPVRVDRHIHRDHKGFDVGITRPPDQIQVDALLGGAVDLEPDMAWAASRERGSAGSGGSAFWRVMGVNVTIR